MLEITEENARSSTIALEGFLKMYQGNYHEAIQSFDAALVIIPESHVALQGRALCKSMLFTATPSHEWTSLMEDILSDLTAATSSIKHILER